MTKKELIIKLHDDGLSYTEIGRTIGVSRQYAATVCGKQDVAYFKPIGDTCVYPNLRKWMNENKVTRREFLRRMGLVTHDANYKRFNNILRGEGDPQKHYIDKMLEVTGLTYEVLFEVKQNG